MKKLLENILNYVKAEHTDYAIMINGEWGSGKTYFWDNEAKKKLEKLTIDGKKFQTIYISLYGVSKLEEINKKIFIETSHLMDKNINKYMKTYSQDTIPEYTKICLDMLNLFGISSTNSEKVSCKDFFSIENKVLCFDDIERSNIDVLDILGYINNFVEHDHIKTIILCNENELSNKFAKKETYEKMKEKLIGQTFKYEPQDNCITNGIFSIYESNENLYKFLKANSKNIIATFKQSHTDNLRILKQALNDFEKIYDVIDKLYPNTNEIVMQTMLIFTIASSFEIKTKRITQGKLENIQNNEEYISILDNGDSSIKEFDKIYYYNLKTDFRFFKFIEKYICTREFDEKLFKEEIEKAELITTGENKIPAYKQILNEEYYKISENKFAKTMKEILDNIKTGEFELIEITKLYFYYIYFCKNGLIKNDIKKIKTDFISGMKKSAKHSKYIKEANKEIERISVYDFSDDSKEIIETFNNLNNSLLEKEYKLKASELFKLVPMKMEKFYERFDKECMDAPIFKYYDAHQMFQRISWASNDAIVMIKEKMIQRAQTHPDIAKEESEKMQELKNIINEYIEGKDVTIKIVLLREFANNLG